MLRLKLRITFIKQLAASFIFKGAISSGQLPVVSYNKSFLEVVLLDFVKMALALIPSLLGQDWWDTWDFPSVIMDQCFASPLVDSDLLQPAIVNGFRVNPRSQANIASSGKSEVTNDDKEFKVALNVSQFKPEELEVKVVDNYIVIHGKHEEKSDEHGFVKREFTRKYMLPRGCEMDTVASSLGPDGILTITAPKKALELPPKQERDVPIKSETTG